MFDNYFCILIQVDYVQHPCRAQEEMKEMEKQPSLKASCRKITERDSPTCLQERLGPHMDP